MLRQYELVERVKNYNPGADEALLNRAYVFSARAHGMQKRANGDPYFSHPVEVAGLLSEKRLDDASVIAGLLHDTLEDTDITIDELKRQFNDEVADLVSGVTKLSALELQSTHTREAENFRKLVMAMSRDIRVLLIKLADRLHNMRTLEYISDAAKRERIAHETRDIYVPLAERIGVGDWQEELDDIAFRELNPQAHQSLSRRLKQLHKNEGRLPVTEMIGLLEKLCHDHGIEVRVTGREKRISSIWRKVNRQDTSFEQLTDITAFRIITRKKEDCYRILGLVHDCYPVIPGRFKDYISLPKQNGYQSIHTTVFDEEGRRIEVQIRTDAMHHQAEYGVAAHWRYKQGKPVEMPNEGAHYGWIRHFLDILEDADSPQDFLENTKLDLYRDQVFVFTPRGEIRDLPSGATVLDFAYMVHSDIGHHCTGARINSRMVSLKTKLRNGDQIEIITGRKQSPSAEWMNFVRTGRARGAIRRARRQLDRQLHIKTGLEKLKLSLAEINRDYNEKQLVPALEKYNSDSPESLLLLIGRGEISALDVRRHLFPDHKPSEKKSAGKKLGAKKAGRHNISAKINAFHIPGLEGDIPVKIGRCCHPIPGDTLTGVIVNGRGITAHMAGCHIIRDILPEKQVDIFWADLEDVERHFTGRIKVAASSKSSAIEEITNSIGKMGGETRQLKVVKRNDGEADILLNVHVKNSFQLEDIIANLDKLPIVHYAMRLL